MASISLLQDVWGVVVYRKEDEVFGAVPLCFVGSGVGDVGKGETGLEILEVG